MKPSQRPDWWAHTSNPATANARATVHWFLNGERMPATLTRLYRALMNMGFTEGAKRWII